MKKSQPRITGELAEKAFWYQLHVFQVCQWLVCVIPSVLAIVLSAPALKAFMQHGPQIWYMTLVKLLVAVPFVLGFAALAYLAFPFGAVLAVLLIRLLVPQLRLPEARSTLLQFYSDPRWLYQGNGTKRFPWWISLWGGMGKNKHLNRWCRSLTAGTVTLVYGRQVGAAQPGD